MPFSKSLDNCYARYHNRDYPEKLNHLRGWDGKPRVFLAKTACCLDTGQVTPVHDRKHLCSEVIMARVIAAKFARLALCLVVLIFSLMVGTALSALFIKAVEL